jgi:hypothetical protein
MGKKHFTEEQIAFALRQAEAGTPVTEIIRRRKPRRRKSVQVREVPGAGPAGE